jgi:hypothetical protein
VVAVLALTAALVAVPALRVARALLFPKQYDVVSIAMLPEYQDPALIERAWALPVAARYGHAVDPQHNVSVCGPATAANAFRSLGSGPATAAAVLDGTGRCRWLGHCWNGLTLDELAEVVRAKTDRSVTVLRDLTLEEFREHMRRTNDSSRRYLVNFHRGLLFGQGSGHHSPIGGYLPDRDLVFVLDVNPSFGPWLVPAERLHRAVHSTDRASGKGRGLLVIE